MMFDVITIGTATQDVYLLGKSFKVIKDPHFTSKVGFPEHEGICFALGGKIEVDDIFMTTGGGATNAAVTFARQGFRTGTLAKIGKDIAGELIEKELKKEKVAPLLVRDPNGHTGFSTLLLTPGGERTILVYRGASHALQASDIPWEKLRASWAYIVSGGIEFPLLVRLIRFLSKQGTMVALNPGREQLRMGVRKMKPILEKTNVLLVNREEASRLTGIPYESEQKIFEVLDQAVPGILVVTDAKRGVKVSDGRVRLQAGIFRKQNVIDRTGAGDAFGSGFVAGLMRKRERCEKGLCNPAHIAYAIRLASANATSNIESIGAKSGILTRKAFEKPRWRSLRVAHFK